MVFFSFKKSVDLHDKFNRNLILLSAIKTF